MRTEHTMQRADRGGLVRARLETLAAVTSTARQKALSLNLAPPWHHLRDLLLGIHRLEPIRGYDEAYLSIRTPDVLARIEKGDPSWERLVPPAVADIIKARKLFGWAEASGPAGRVQSRSAEDAG